MSMTKKDYELIALSLNITKPSRQIMPYHIETASLDIRNVYSYGNENAWDNTCKTLADMLSTDNPRFDKKRFLQACGIGDD